MKHINKVLDLVIEFTKKKLVIMFGLSLILYFTTLTIIKFGRSKSEGPTNTNIIINQSGFDDEMKKSVLKFFLCFSR